MSAQTSDSSLALIQQLNEDLVSLTVEAMDSADALSQRLQPSNVRDRQTILQQSRELAVRANQFWEMRLARALCSAPQQESRSATHNLIG